MRMLLGVGMGLVLAGCSSDTIVVNGTGDGGPGADSSTNDGSPADDGATQDSSGPVEAGPPDRSKCTIDPDKIGMTTRTYTGAPNKYMVYVPKTYDMNVPSALVEILHGAGDTTPNYITLWKPVADMRNAI